MKLFLSLILIHSLIYFGPYGLMTSWGIIILTVCLAKQI